MHDYYYLLCEKLMKNEYNFSDIKNYVLQLSRVYVQLLPILMENGI